MPLRNYTLTHSPISCRSSAGQGKFAGQRPTFYQLCHAINQPVCPRPTCQSNQRFVIPSQAVDYRAVYQTDHDQRIISSLLCCSESSCSSFLSRVSILTRDIDIANLSVRLSVCLSVTFRYQMKTLNMSSQCFHHTVAHLFYFYQHQTSSRNSDGVTPAGPCGGAKYRWGIKI